MHYNLITLNTLEFKKIYYHSLVVSFSVFLSIIAGGLAELIELSCYLYFITYSCGVYCQDGGLLYVADKISINTLWLRFV